MNESYEMWHIEKNKNYVKLLLDQTNLGKISIMENLYFALYAFLTEYHLVWNRLLMKLLLILPMRICRDL